MSKNTKTIAATTSTVTTLAWLSTPVVRATRLIETEKGEGVGFGDRFPFANGQYSYLRTGRQEQAPGSNLRALLRGILLIRQYHTRHSSRMYAALGS